MELESLNLKPRTQPEPDGPLARYKKYKEETGRDFIFDEADRVMVSAGDDPEIKYGAYQHIVNLILEYPKPYQHEFYIKALGKRFKPLKHWRDEYKTQTADRIETAEIAAAPSSDADTSTLEELGFYTQDNKYFFATQGGFEEGTNFVIEPLFHIASPSNNRRLIRVTNTYNHSILCDVPSDAMVGVDSFQRFLYAEGNYIIFVSNHHFKKLLLHLGDHFPKCDEIRTFGWQPEGFWAFSDGSYNGQWHRVDNMGIMSHKNKNYFSPAFSDVYSQLRIDDDLYENDRRFVYRQGKTTLKEWCTLVQKVHSFNQNGQYAIAFLAAALYRSHIYSLFKIFPHLFLHGEKQSGKSQMAWTLSNLFQLGAPPFNLSAGTDVAYFRLLARFRDAIIWFDEYTDAISETRFQAMKSAYDGVGREKGKLSRDSRTESDKINSAMVISGQHLPQRDDNSLYTRSVVCFFVKPKDGIYTAQETRDITELRRRETEGLSQVITSLLDLRPVVESKFAMVFSDIFDAYKEELAHRGLIVDDRILRNYTIMAAMVSIIQKETKADIMINAELFRARCLNDAIEQSEKIRSSDATGTFWKLIASLIQEQALTKADYDIQQKITETRTHKTGGENELVRVDFEKPTRILYLDFDRAYNKYAEAHRRIFGMPSIGPQTMIDYCRNHFSYVGLKGSHYFSGGSAKRTSAHMFNFDELVQRRTMPDFDSPSAMEDFTAPPAPGPDNRNSSENSQTEISFDARETDEAFNHPSENVPY